MDIRNIHIIANIFILVCFCLVFLACYIEPIQTEISSVTKSFLLKRLKASKSKYFNYDRLSIFIKEYGVQYIFNESVDPVIFIFIKIIAGTLAGAAVINFIPNIFLVMAAFIAGFFLVDLIVKMNNKQDNDNMMKDIANVYDIMKAHTKANIYIADSVLYCYQICENKRLKDAFNVLYNDMLMSGNITQSLWNFNSKFRNPMIDTLCAILEQSLETGRSAEMLDNITKKMLDVQKLLNERYKNKKENKFHFLSILLVLGLFGIIVFAIGSDFANVLSEFN